MTALTTHVSREPDAGSRGLAFGRANAAAVGRTVERYRRIFSELLGLDDAGIRAAGERVSTALTGHPGLVDEITGIAEGAGVRAAELFAVNARSEVLGSSGRPECSVLAVEPTAFGAGVLLAQNWDWYPDFGDSLIWWQVAAGERGWFATLTEAGVLAKIGINSRGVGVTLNRLISSGDQVGDGMPVHLAIRLVLERAERLDDAVALLAGQRYDASSAITLGGAGPTGPSVASVEVSPSGVSVVRPDGAGRLAHTNHFLIPPSQGSDAGPGRWPDSLGRFACATAGLAGFAVDAEQAKATLRSHEGFPRSICAHVDESLPYLETGSTLASVVMDLGAPSVEMAWGQPCTSEYVALPLFADVTGTGGSRR